MLTSPHASRIQNPTAGGHRVWWGQIWQLNYLASPGCWAWVVAGNVAIYFLGSFSASLTISGGHVLPILLFQLPSNPPFMGGLPPLHPGPSLVCSGYSLLNG